MIGTLITLIVYAIVLGLLYWLVDYLLGVFPLPDPIPRIIRAVMIVIIVLILISIILGLAGVEGVPRLRLYGP
jgi:hypothetical protein